MIPPLFRVWHDVEEGHMYPVNGIQINENGTWTVNAGKWHEWVPIQVSGKWQSGYLMQSIGRKDKNGKEIFVGDIVDCDRYQSHEIYQAVIINISHIPECMYGSALNSIEVVGNLFQNKDLTPHLNWERCMKEIKGDKS